MNLSACLTRGRRPCANAAAALYARARRRVERRVRRGRRTPQAGHVRAGHFDPGPPLHLAAGTAPCQRDRCNQGGRRHGRRYGRRHGRHHGRLVQDDGAAHPGVELLGRDPCEIAPYPRQRRRRRPLRAPFPDRARRQPVERPHRRAAPLPPGGALAGWARRASLARRAPPLGQGPRSRLGRQRCRSTVQRSEAVVGVVGCRGAQGASARDARLPFLQRGPAAAALDPAPRAHVRRTHTGAQTLDYPGSSLPSPCAALPSH